MGTFSFGRQNGPSIVTRLAALSLLVTPPISTASAAFVQQPKFNGPNLMKALKASSWRGASSQAPTFKEGDVVVLLGIKPEGTCPHVNASWSLNRTLLRPTVQSLGTSEHRVIFAYVNPTDAQKAQKEITQRDKDANVVADPTYTVLINGGFDRSTTIVMARVVAGQGGSLTFSQIGSKPWQFGIAPHIDLLKTLGNATGCGNATLQSALDAIGKSNLYRGDIFHDGKEPTAGCGYEFRQGGDG